MKRLIAVVVGVLVAWILAGAPTHHSGRSVPTMAEWDALRYTVGGPP